MAAKQVRQGHILLDPVKAIPEGAVKLPPTRPGEVVLATGETGREHIFKSGRVFLYQHEGSLFIEVSGDDPVYLEHPEHGHIEIEPGDYKIVEQIEDDSEFGFGEPRQRSSYD
jgi:hypothetical protein